MGTTPQRIPDWLKIDFVGKRRIWFSIAGVLIAISIGSLIVKGLNLGIDFEGGSQIAFTTEQAQSISTVRDELGQLGFADATIFGSRRGAGGWDVHRVLGADGGAHDRGAAADPDGALVRARASFTETRNVSASFSEQILRSTIVAIIVSFLLITIYISIRFQWRFAVPILRTIVNDGVIALGIYSLSGREVSAATVAAFLTIIGYSIYDTIIVFDRVRENLPLMRHATIAQTINTSVWETVRRSLATTFITLLPVGALFFFGGDTLKDFAFAILIGIGISAFSTLFIAAPFLAVLLEHAPEYKRQGLQAGATAKPVVSVGCSRAGRAGARDAGGGCGGHRRTARGAPLGDRVGPARASPAAPQRPQAARPRTLTFGPPTLGA